MNQIFSLFNTITGSLILLTILAESTGLMRSEGKINVVYGIIMIVFIGISLFLFYLERKISKIEKKINND